MPFRHLTVLDVASLGAAPQIAAFFGDFGARVIKIEPPRGDSLRQLVDRRGTALQWQLINRNKRSITLDVGEPRGRELLGRLLDRADLLVSNLTRERLERWELRAKDLAARHPRLVAVNLTAYGTSGPWADRPGSGTLAECVSGLAALTGAADGPPTLSPVGLGDYLGVLQGIVAALMGLYARDAGGGAGTALDVAMVEPLLGLLAQRIAVTARDGTEPGRHGNRFPTMAPRNTYRTGDGEWVAITAGTDELVRRALAVVGRPELADDPRFCTNLARVAHADELDEVLAGWIGARPCAEVVDAFTRAGVSLAAVDGLRRVTQNPHFIARGDLTTIGEGEGAITTAAPTPHYAPAPGRVASLGGALGEANEEIYGGLLGLAPDEIEALRRDGVI